MAAVDTLLTPMRLVHALSSSPTLRPLPVLLVARGTARAMTTIRSILRERSELGPRGSCRKSIPGVRVAHVDVDSDVRRSRNAGGGVCRERGRTGGGLPRGSAVQGRFEAFNLGAADPPNDMPEKPVFSSPVDWAIWG